MSIGQRFLSSGGFFYMVISVSFSLSISHFITINDYIAYGKRGISFVDVFYLFPSNISHVYSIFSSFFCAVFLFLCVLSVQISFLFARLTVGA